MFTAVPRVLDSRCSHSRTSPMKQAASSTAAAVTWGHTSRHGNGDFSGRVLGVTTKPSGRWKYTLATAVTQARIHSGNRAREYWWPRHVLTPYPTTKKSSWFAMTYGAKSMRKVRPYACTGRIPKHR